MQEAQARLKREIAEAPGADLATDMDIDEGPTGPPFLYDTYYPTMLPFRPPDEEALDDASAVTNTAALQLQAQSMVGSFCRAHLLCSVERSQGCIAFAHWVVEVLPDQSLHSSQSKYLQGQLQQLLPPAS